MGLLILFFTCITFSKVWSFYRQSGNNDYKRYKELYYNIPKLKLKQILRIYDNKLNIGEVKDKIIFRAGNTTSSFKQYINILINPIKLDINSKTHINCDIQDYNWIIYEIDIHNNKKYTIDFFIYDKASFTKIKLVTELVILSDRSPVINYVHLSESSEYNKLSISENTSDFDKFREKNKPENPLVGYESNNKLPNTEIQKTLNTTGKQSISVIANKWIEPKEALILEREKKKVFPCRKIYNRWDTKGLHIVDSLSDDCYGINSSGLKRNIISNVNPTIGPLPRDNLGLLGGVFNNDYLIPSFP